MKRFKATQEAINCMKAHKEAFEEWREGAISDVWRDEQGILCIRYESGNWWHYRITGSGCVEWW